MLSFNFLDMVARSRPLVPSDIGTNHHSEPILVPYGTFKPYLSFTRKRHTWLECAAMSSRLGAAADCIPSPVLSLLLRAWNSFVSPP
jgi:hypothetical protein